MTRTLSGIPGGQPSMITTLAGPWDSPAVVMRNAWPKLFPGIVVLILVEFGHVAAAVDQTSNQ